MRRLLLTSVLLALGWALAAAPAHARTFTAPCVGPMKSGPMCHFWTARAVSVNDGDTIGAVVDGTHKVWQVRFTGAQAMELHTYNWKHLTGECNAVAAARRVKQLLRKSHNRILLSAQNPNKRFDVRLGRWIDVKVHGRWRDLYSFEMAEGHVLWMPDETETAWNNVYNKLSQQAAQKQIGLWDPTHCGVGPHQDVPLRMWVNWDPHGIDVSNLNDEWVKIQNLSTTESLPLTQWWMRDSGLRRFTFPRGTVLRPGATITIHDGPGRNTDSDLFWNIHAAVFQNIGDGAYLFDPQGDIRTYMVYPCVVACSDPNQGALRISTQLKGTQYVQVQNVSNHAVNLYGYQLDKPGWPYDFGPNTVLQPGETLRVDLDGATAQNSQFDRHWGMPYPHLHRDGDVVRVATFNNITIACDAWGGFSCS